MTYTIEQFLAAAEAAEVSMIDAQHTCDTLVKMNDAKNCMTCKYGNLSGGKEPCFSCGTEYSNYTHEPTTETF